MVIHLNAHTLLQAGEINAGGAAAEDTSEAAGEAAEVRQLSSPLGTFGRSSLTIAQCGPYAICDSLRAVLQEDGASADHQTGSNQGRKAAEQETTAEVSISDPH